ncbi:MAG: hypothetical protein AB1629_03400 [Candidatus Omnitrophota bacterium]
MKFKGILVLFLAIVLAGCAGSYAARRNIDYAIKEAEWIKDGKPLIYDNKSWYATEFIENHLDNEMEYVGEFQNAPFYVERRQIKPYNRIYTKFDYHKYRLFLERKPTDYDKY